ncbi:MAG: hypothetical protein ACOCRX_03870 [Candidatus Woesearchaeota archaeon]
MNFDDENTKDMDKLVKIAIEDFKNNKLPFADDIENTIGYINKEIVEQEIRDNFSPDDIVDHAEA